MMLGNEPLLDPLLKYQSSGGFRLNGQIEMGNLVFNVVFAGIVIGIIVCFLYWRRKRNEVQSDQPAKAEAEAEAEAEDRSGGDREPRWLSKLYK